MAQARKISELLMTDALESLDQFVLNQAGITKRTSIAYLRAALASVAKFGDLRFIAFADVDLPENSRLATAPLADFPLGISKMQVTAVGGWPGGGQVMTVRSAGTLTFQIFMRNMSSRPEFRAAATATTWTGWRFNVQTILGNNLAGGVMTWDDVEKVITASVLANLSPIPQIRARGAKATPRFDSMSALDVVNVNVTDSGHPYIRLGNWPLTAGVLKSTTNNAGNRFLKVDMGEVDGELTVLFQMQSGSTPGILLRGDGTTNINFIAIRVDYNLGTIEIRSMPQAANASHTSVKTAKVLMSTVPQELTVRAVGRRVQVDWNGRTVLDELLTTTVHELHQATHWGLYSNFDAGLTSFLSWFFRPRRVAPAPAVPAVEETLPAYDRVVVDSWSSSDLMNRPLGCDPQGRLYSAKTGNTSVVTISQTGDPNDSVDLMTLPPGLLGANGVVALDDGELLAFRQDKIWKTNGFNGSTISSLSEVLNAGSGLFARTVKAWRNHVLVTQYSGVDRGHAGSQKVWLSTQYGDLPTFTLIRDLNTEFANANYHIHACEIDPWRRRYYVVMAHETYLQDTWWASWDTPTVWNRIDASWYSRMHGWGGEGGVGATTLTATRRGLLLGTDVNSPRGVLRMHPETFNITEDFLHDNATHGPGGTGWWCHEMFVRNAPGSLLLGAWRVMGLDIAQPGRVTASADGQTHHVIWEDPIAVYPASSGVTGIVGPTKSGHVVGFVTRPGPEPSETFWGIPRIEATDPTGAR